MHFGTLQFVFNCQFHKALYNDKKRDIYILCGFYDAVSLDGTRNCMWPLEIFLLQQTCYIYNIWLRKDNLAGFSQSPGEERATFLWQVGPYPAPHGLAARKAHVMPLMPISALTNCAYDACGMARQRVAGHGMAWHVLVPPTIATSVTSFFLGNENFNMSATAPACLSHAYGRTSQHVERHSNNNSNNNLKHIQPSALCQLSYVFRCLLTNVADSCSPRAIHMHNLSTW